MPQFRKDGVAVEAVQFARMDGNTIVYEQEPPNWLLDAMVDTDIDDIGSLWEEDGIVCIGTMSGVAHADPGDWIVRGANGGLFPVKDGIFATTYEAVE